MAIKDLVSNFTRRRREHSEKIRELDENVRVEKLVHERQLSSNERELLSYKKERHEALVNKLVARERARKTGEFLHGQDIYKHKNIFAGQNNIMKQKNVLDGHKPILHQKNIFGGHS